MKKTFIAFLICTLSTPLVYAVEVFKLTNGLTVVIDPIPDATKVAGIVAVRAGSRDEELNATGVAHYLEHMLFKGNQDFGTSNWEKEKPLIDELYTLYDKLQEASSEEQEKEIYKRIDELSQKTAMYIIPNELSAAVQKMGGVSMNAFTSLDLTAYFNIFPREMIQRWISLYAYRFQKPVFRLFQTELETVYEEKNRSENNPFSKYQKAVLEKIFKQHPYGRPIIGKTAHLKKPWLRGMRDFFEKWYVPGNMSLILSGNITVEEIKPLIEKEFGKWEKKPIAQRKNYTIPPFSGTEKVKLKLTPLPVSALIFRGNLVGSDDETALKVMIQILSNPEQTGLIDKSVLDGEVSSISVSYLPLRDGTNIIANIIPTYDVNQYRYESFSYGEKAFFDAIKKVSNKQVEEELLASVKERMLINIEKTLESPLDRSMYLANLFGKKQPLESPAQQRAKIQSVTLDDIAAVAKKYIGKNYLVIHSENGKNKKPTELKKPDFKPLEFTQHEPSPFMKKLDAIPAQELSEMIDLKKMVKQVPFQENVMLYHTRNKKNKVFSLWIDFSVGTYKLPNLEHAVSLMNRAGVLAQYKPIELKKEFAKLGIDYYFFTSPYHTGLRMEGSEDKLAEACQLISRLILLPRVEDKAFDATVGAEYSSRFVEQKNNQAQLDALMEYALFGKKSRYKDRTNLADLLAMRPSELTAVFTKAINYPAKIHFCGNLSSDEVSKILKDNLALASNKKVDEKPEERKILPITENRIYVVNNSNSTQSDIRFYIDGEPLKKEEIAKLRAFNNYFSGGFNGLMMKEIREYRSLAYNAAASYSLPSYPEWRGNFSGYIGTQSDKTVDAIEVLHKLLSDMPLYPERVKGIQDYLIYSASVVAPDPRTASGYLASVSHWEIDQYLPKILMPEYQKLTFEQLKEFYEKRIKGKHYVIAIVGNTSRFKAKDLSRFGKVKVISSSTLFSKLAW